MKRSILLLLLLLSCLSMSAQTVITGTIVDAETGKAVDIANVVLMEGQKAIDYSLTNDKGEFRFDLKSDPELCSLNITSLGYKPFSITIGSDRVFRIQLEPQAFMLKEVTLRGGRIWGSNDTIRFDAAQFLRSGDKTVEDLLKRLPGINVSDNGGIKYNGKNIGTMYIEGLDLMGSRYKTLSKNLSAESVKGVEVLDNHQRIKSLVGKVSSDATDLNIKLKDDFKDKWTLNSRVAAGFSPKLFLYELEANALQVAKSNQSYYGAKFSNTGNGISKEADEGWNNLYNLPSHRLLSVGGISAPLQEQRWLFDNAMLLTANRLYKTAEDSKLKVNAYYTRDRITQSREDITTFILPESTETLVERQTSSLHKDLIDLSIDYEENASTHFLRNKLEISAGKAVGTTDITGTKSLLQQTTNSSFSIKDNTSYTRQLANGNVVRAQSLIGYSHFKDLLTYDRGSQPFDIKNLYMQADGSIRIGRTIITQEYTAGASLDFNSLKSLHKVWVTPSYEYRFGNYQLEGALPTTLTFIPEDKKTFLLPGASLYIKHKFNYAWNAQYYANYKRKIGDPKELYDKPYWLSYRTVMESSDLVPITDIQNYSFRLEYKDALKEFFMTTSAYYSHSRNNYTWAQDFTDGVFQIGRQAMPHTDTSLGWSLTLSKGFNSLRAKASLELDLSRNSSKQIRNQLPMPYTVCAISIEPKFSISPLRSLDLSYEGRVSHITSAQMGESQRLLTMSHKGVVSMAQKKFDASLTGEYFLNQVTSDKSVGAFFVDAKVGYKLKKVYLSLTARNLLNKQDYSYTIYNPLSVFSSSLGIRPREILFSARFQF